MVGEMQKFDGKINIFGETAYAPQLAWIQNATIKDNILFGRPYEKAFYDQVVSACALIDDFNLLPAGDLTEIGEKVSNFISKKFLLVETKRRFF